MLARLPSYLPWDRISRDLYVSRLIKGVNRYPIDASVRLLFRLIICENYSTGIRDIRAIVPISSSPYFSISSVLSVFFSPHHRAILYPTEKERERGTNFTRATFSRLGKLSRVKSIPATYSFMRSVWISFTPNGRYIRDVRLPCITISNSEFSLGVTRRIKQGQYRRDARIMSIPQVLPRQSARARVSEFPLSSVKGNGTERVIFLFV